MADNVDVTLPLRSNVMNDYICSGCEEDGFQIEAQHFCKRCRRYCCEDCLALHNKLFKKHEILGRDEESAWPILKATVDDFEMCEEHPSEMIKLFCKDHNKSCCVYCHHADHRHCDQVVRIEDEMKGIHDKEEFLEMSEDMKGPFIKRFKAQQREIEKKLEVLEDVYETILFDMKYFREKIITWLDDLEKKSKSELETLLASLKDSCKREIQTNIEIYNKFQHAHKAFENIQNESERNAFILCCKYTNLAEESETLRLRIQNKDVNVLFQPDAGILHLFSELKGLGAIQTYSMKPNEIIRAAESTKHTVRIQSDTNTCDIVSICDLPDGEVLVADQTNSEVKLLAASLRAISKLKLAYPPKHMCNAGVARVAVAVSDGGIHEIQFLRIKQGTIFIERSIQMQHPFTSIAIHDDQLYGTSLEALYKCNIVGHVQTIIYGAKNTFLYKCAVNIDGTRIFVTTYKKNQLLTLAKDGTLLSTFEYPRLRYPEGVHITPIGQVLVCGRRSKNVIQVNEDGREILATVVTGKDILPQCVCFNKQTGTIMVGLYHNDKILVFKTS